MTEVNRATHCTRPWGEWFVLHEEPGYKVKKLVLTPGQATSLQYHFNRDEYWTIVSGNGELYRDYSRVNFLGRYTVPVVPGDQYDIPREAIHRIKNTGTEPLVIIEVWVGGETSEEDVVRLDYGEI